MLIHLLLLLVICFTLVLRQVARFVKNKLDKPKPMGYKLEVGRIARRTK